MNSNRRTLTSAFAALAIAGPMALGQTLPRAPSPVVVAEHRTETWTAKRKRKMALRRHGVVQR